MNRMRRKTAATIGRLGGSSTSEAKRAAARANGRLGGAPRSRAHPVSDRQRDDVALVRETAQPCAEADNLATILDSETNRIIGTLNGGTLNGGTLNGGTLNGFDRRI